jgi:four helix bundle protein
MRPFRELLVWQKSHALALDVYTATAAFPPHERYGLTSQMRRSATSIPTNIVEGAARDGAKEFNQFLAIALGSAAELEYQLLLSRDLKYLKPDHVLNLTNQVEEVKRMLVSFRKQLRVGVEKANS